MNNAQLLMNYFNQRIYELYLEDVDELLKDFDTLYNSQLESPDTDAVADWTFDLFNDTFDFNKFRADAFRETGIRDDIISSINFQDDCREVFTNKYRILFNDYVERR